MRACWLKWVGRDWSISADYIWLNYSDANIQKSFGMRCKELRAGLGCSQEQFANLIEMDRSYYASIEVGRRNVSLSNLKKIADGFQISIAELMRGVS